MNTSAPKLRVLFVCVYNSARSVMAQYFLSEMGGSRFEPHSAGFEPKPVLPVAQRAMAEIGRDISGHQARSVYRLAEDGELFDYVIMVCDDPHGHDLPAFAGASMLHWRFAEPSAFEGSDQDKQAQTNQVRDALKEAVRAWVAELSAS